LQINYCDFPDDALYDVDNRVWIRRLGEEAANVGITSVYSALAGRLSKVSFKPVGTVLRRGQSVATIESVRYFGVVRTPLSGTLIETNSVLTEQPKLANDSPYELGWLVKVETGFLAEEMSSLSDPASAEESLKAQISQLRVRCFKAYPDYEMWEIGVECAAVLVRLNELIERCALNEVIHVVSDDPTADIEMERWSDETGQLILESRKEGKLAHFIVKKAK
jgi:glycine cleavage system H protein